LSNFDETLVEALAAKTAFSSAINFLSAFCVATFALVDGFFAFSSLINCDNFFCVF